MNQVTEAQQLVIELYRRGMIKTWYRDQPNGWTLFSGLWSPLYIQLRPLCSYPDLLRKVGEQIGRIVREKAPGASRLLGLAMAGIPLAVSTSLAINLPCAMTRKIEGLRSPTDVASYGEHNNVEGELVEGDDVVLIDDLVTTMGSKRVGMVQLQAEVKRRGLANVRCNTVVVLFDREQGAREAAQAEGINLYSVIPFLSEGLPTLKSQMAAREYEVICDYLANSSRYQETAVKAALRDEAVRASQSPA
jgi:orotate phosphoribosyltransferase